jgi:transposase-like protein
MPTPYPEEFRRDVIAVARQGDRSRAQVARSFGISESCLARWLRIADREDGIDEAPPPTGGAGGGNFLCAIKYAYSNRIVGYSMAEKMTSRLAVDELTNALAPRRPTAATTVVHSDRGSQTGLNRL